MNSKSLLISLLVAGMSMGTAWAIRGQFGHEQGAAWAGSIGALSVLLVAKRADWYSRVFKATLAAAAGWGIGGIMSYGIVVGYGRGVDFVNVYYGLVMLFIIGGLYGFIGGGLFGLALADSSRKRVLWPQLIVEMFVGAVVVYFFLIEEWGWLMTPPRSEMWAACLGMAFALTWFIYRTEQYSALRVAVFAGLGAGFGFAFGNFLQVMGGVSTFKFNFWNVMEYSIGFFGGAGMAYGTFTSRWEPAEDPQKRRSQWFPLLTLTLVIPFIVWEQTFERKRLEEIYTKITAGDVTALAQTIQWVALAALLIAGISWFMLYYRTKRTEFVSYDYSDVRTFFIGHFSLYAAFSFLITGAFMSGYRPEQYLYLVNLGFVTLLIGNAKPRFSNRGLYGSRLAMGFALLLVFIALLTLVAINLHGEMKGMNRRFE
ncbi:hypothetical protein GCM10028803_19330 [Larkinella knui]|uniref:DUF3464 family protein n=1 Tax=Larkinella knui TaxID=2025310 RepID=A0A3P1CUU7_9BACT|nr:hypothetical protein [Larkinella knui]RRB17028.1 hypothetical protein EHT87_01730 [Larkinella knui]